MTVDKTKEEKLVIEGRLKDKIIQDLADDVVELSKSDVSAWAQDAYETAKAEINELRSENEKLKKLLKESFESFPTKRLADRIYSIDGIERPEPEPIPKAKEDEEISF